MTSSHDELASSDVMGRRWRLLDLEDSRNVGGIMCATISLASGVRSPEEDEGRMRKED